MKQVNFCFTTQDHFNNFNNKVVIYLLTRFVFIFVYLISSNMGMMIMTLFFKHSVFGHFSRSETVNPLMHKVPKWSQKYCSIFCKIFKVCLTILGHYAWKDKQINKKWIWEFFKSLGNILIDLFSIFLCKNTVYMVATLSKTVFIIYGIW